MLINHIYNEISSAQCLQQHCQGFRKGRLICQHTLSECHPLTAHVDMNTHKYSQPFLNGTKLMFLVYSKPQNTKNTTFGVMV
jgi:hypothetical protein